MSEHCAMRIAGKFVPPPPPPPEGGMRRALLALCAAAAAVVFFAAGAERAAAQTQTVTIPDANLRAQLESALGKASGEAITRAEMATLGSGPNRQLSLSRAGIEDLTGLEYAVNVRILSLLQERNFGPYAAQGPHQFARLVL